MADFGAALAALKTGRRVARAGWNGKGMFLFLVPGSRFVVNRPPLLGIYPEGTTIDYHAHVDKKTAQGDVVPWLCSQTDMLADDWEAVDGAAIGEAFPTPAFDLTHGMTRYVGTKTVYARRITRGDYVAMRGWELPADENANDEGYLVEYTDKLDSRVPGFRGYVTWSPADVFEQAYREI